MRFLVASANGVAAAAFGWVAAALIGTGIAAAIGMSDVNGPAFAVVAVGPVGGVLGLCIAVPLAFRRAGHRGFCSVAWRSVMTITVILAVTVGGPWAAGVANNGFGRRLVSALGGADLTGAGRLPH